MVAPMDMKTFEDLLKGRDAGITMDEAYKCSLIYQYLQTRDAMESIDVNDWESYEQSLDHMEALLHEIMELPGRGYDYLVAIVHSIMKPAKEHWYRKAG